MGFLMTDSICYCLLPSRFILSLPLNLTYAQEYIDVKEHRGIFISAEYKGAWLVKPQTIKHFTLRIKRLAI